MGTSVVRFKNAEGSASRWGVLRGADIFPLNLDIADHRGLMRQYFNDRAGFDTAISQGSVPMSDVLEARSVAEEDLESLIGALVLANDVSARDFMFGAPAMQWFKGKSQKTFCPMGPVLYLLDEGDLSKLYQLQLTLKINGELRQDATTDLLIHKPAASLAEISTFAGMRAGDCILTGTPGGVLLKMDLKTGLSILLNLKNDAKRRAKFVAAQLAKTRYLQPGDVLELEIKSLDGSINLGSQTNKVVEA